MSTTPAIETDRPERMAIASGVHHNSETGDETATTVRAERQSRSLPRGALAALAARCANAEVRQCLEIERSGAVDVMAHAHSLQPQWRATNARPGR